MRGVKAAVLATVAIALGGCTTSDLPVAGGSCAGDATAALEGIDWEDAQVVEVKIRQDNWAPMVFGLLRERPYVLRLSNGDDGNHGFRAPDFFQSVAVDSVAVNGEAIGQTCLTDIALPVGAVAEIRLVALRDGRYAFKSSSSVDLGIGYNSGYGIGAVLVR